MIETVQTKVSQLEPKHWMIIGAMLMAVGTQIGGMEHGWHDALTPGWVSGFLIQIGTTIGAIFVGAPKQPWDGTLRRGADARAVVAAVDAKVLETAKAAVEVKP